jgi:lysophospholipase L1-like esterase
MDPLADYFDFEKREKIKHYKILNQYVKKGQILFVGSSLMEQFPLYEFLQTHPVQKTIYNRGIGGATTSELMDVLDTCVFDLEPAKIFLNIGTNDINGEDYQEAGLISRYRAILEKIMARLPESVLYLMAYYPVNELDDFGNPFAKEWLKTRTNRRINNANTQIEILAAQLGCRFVNVNAGLLDDQCQLKKEYTVEGVHMYANAYRVIFDALLPYILEE